MRTRGTKKLPKAERNRGNSKWGELHEESYKGRDVHARF